MQSSPNAARKTPAPGPRRTPEFLIELEPWHRVFLQNLVCFLRPSPPQFRLTTLPGRYWEDALVHRPVAWDSIGKSLLLHLVTIAAVMSLDYFWVYQPRIVPEDITRSRSLEHYELTEYLPPVNSRPRERPQPPVRPQAQQADPEYSPQEIITIDPNHNSIRQTIVNPTAPAILTRDTPLPNIVAWTPVPASAPMAPNRPLQPVPAFTPEAAPPPEDAARRNLNALQFPVSQPQVAGPASQPIARNLSALNLPEGQQAAVPPSGRLAPRPAGDINMGFMTPTVEPPKLPAPNRVVMANGQPSRIARPATGGGGSSAPPVIAGSGKTQGNALGQLIVLNASPAPPRVPLNVPEGNRKGEFAAGPTGRPGATARPEIAAGDTKPPAGDQSGGNTPSIFVSNPPEKVTALVAVSAPPPPAPTPKPDLPKATDIQKPFSPPAGENEVFRDKKFYSMTLNMPNLTSGGGSWILRFAELNPLPGSNGEGVSGPVALSKSDPAYPAALVRDRVEGTVVLYAVIHSDGHVGEVRVLEGVNEILDENARAALMKWRFRPGTKNGVPIDLEAVIKIPFRVRRNTF